MEVGVSWSPASSLRLALPCGCWPIRQRGLGAGRLPEGPADQVPANGPAERLEKRRV